MTIGGQIERNGWRTSASQPNDISAFSRAERKGTPVWRFFAAPLWSICVSFVSLMYGHCHSTRSSSELIRRIQSVRCSGGWIDHDAGSAQRSGLRINNIVNRTRHAPTQGDWLPGRYRGRICRKGTDGRRSPSRHIRRSVNRTRLDDFKIGRGNLF